MPKSITEDYKINDSDEEFIIVGPDGEEIEVTSGQRARELVKETEKSIDQELGHKLCGNTGIERKGEENPERNAEETQNKEEKPTKCQPLPSLPHEDFSNVEDVLVTLKIKIAAMKKDTKAKNELIVQQMNHYVEKMLLLRKSREDETVL